MKFKSILFLSLFFTLLFQACVPPDYGKTKFEGIAIDFKDKQIQEIYNLEQRQSVDSLLFFLRHDNPTHRYLAALVFGSLKEKKAVDSLFRLLKDDVSDVRVATAFALGQIGDVRAEIPLLNAFEGKDTEGSFSPFNAAVMEAIGKCGKSAFLKDLCNITTFKMSDSVLLEGQALGIYRYGLRDTFNDLSIRKMVSFVENGNYPSSVRVIAANYLSRIKTKYDTTVTNTVGRIALQEKDVNVRMALARALGKVFSPILALPTLQTLYEKEADYRVKVNIINGLNDFEYVNIQPLLMQALKDKQVQVANTAAQFFINHGKESDAGYYKLYGSSSELATSTRHLMSAAALKWLVFYPKIRDSVNVSMQFAYKNAKNDYDKARLLRGLAEFSFNYDFIKNEALNVANPLVVRTAGAEAIAQIATSPDFFKNFRSFPIKEKQNLKNILFQLVHTGDAGVAAVAADAIRNPEAQFNRKLMKDSISGLYQTMRSLKLPQELETYESIRQTINYIADTVAVAVRKTASAKTTDWSIITNFNGQTPVATVKTAKGVIKMELLVNNAPISVANFINLARIGFFNGKIFHRVVPNFVAQTGCPRGDGYGSLDFTISSELTPMHYFTEGVVGMASAGNHTECSQWFITHSPTLHLDPNYTIFARVTEGMSVVHQLGVGDVMGSVVIN